jgi:2,4-dienoyl-CoA reductase-like NADH-dependent reductase (Old Yellow Enzyme family)
VPDPLYPRVASFKTAEAFETHLQKSGIQLGFDKELLPPERQPLAEPLSVEDVRIGNRFCILPMEGWDGTPEGEPSELTCRRWRHFGQSGAKFIWGGEAVAVRHDGRANPNQLLLTEKTQPALARLRQALVAAHRERYGSNADSDLYVGLQLTHSGRFSKPNTNDRPEPLTAYAHPLLDRRLRSGAHQFSDDELDQLVADFVVAARRARDAGFAFVDVKHCHGYLGHELLSARLRPGRYGGSFVNRTRFMREIIDGIRASAPGLGVVVRLSAFDTVPFRQGAHGQGVPETGTTGYCCAFDPVLDGHATSALEESRAVLELLRQRGVRFICVTAGSPYYSPHIQRPALFPPFDGYGPPEDPLQGVARQIEATARLKAAFPALVFVGSAYSYLQEWLPHVAQFNVRNGLVDFVGLGRVALSYPELPADVLSGAPLRRKLLCRTFSDCTNGPRLGLVSGCFPLDPFYAAHEHAERIREAKAPSRS